MIRRVFRNYPSRAYLLVTFLISWAVWIPLALKENGLVEESWIRSPIFGFFGPLLSALIITSVCNSRAGVDRLIRGHFEFKHILPWFLAAILVPLAFWVTSSLLFESVPHNWLEETGKHFSPPVGIVLFSILCWGFGGEAGWRAHLMTHLEPRHGFLLSCTAVFACWALWFTPLFFFHPTYQAMGVSQTLLWLFQLLCFSIVLGWVFKRTQGNLITVGVLYGMLQVQPNSAEYSIFFTVSLFTASLFAFVSNKLEDSIVPTQYQVRELEPLE